MQALIEQFILLLRQELPGSRAHRIMAPMGRIDTESYLSQAVVSPKISAVMLVLFPEDLALRMVLTKRPEYAGTHSGQVSLPGGKYELGDKDYLTTALRETHEEVGIKPSEIQLLGALSRIYIPPSNFLVYPYVGFCSQKPIFKPDPKEVSKMLFPPISLFTSENIVKKGKFSASGGSSIVIEAPYFEIEEEKVWGATAAILSEFKEIVKKIIS